MTAKKQKQPQSGRGQQLLFVLLGMAAGFGAGISMAWLSDYAGGGVVLLWAVSVFAGFSLQLILHEAGHLVCGLATGYRFVSFRIGSWMLQREHGKLQLRKYTLAGTGGQCLLALPPLTDGKMPYILYNLGGPLANLLTAVLLGLAALLSGSGVARIFCGTQAVIGLFLALSNGLPLRGAINNDGANARAMGKDPAALRSLWVQLSVNAGQAEGIRLKEMPEAWFALPTEAELQNSMTAVLAALRENRLMDEHRFDEAAALIDRLSAEPHGQMPLYDSLFLCDRLYLSLLRGEDTFQWLEAWEAKPMLQFRKAMRNFPAVLRTEYAAALHLGDTAGAEQMRSRFEAQAKRYPYPGEIEGERELINLSVIPSGCHLS